MVSYDKIRSMSDDELKQFLEDYKKPQSKLCSKCGKGGTKTIKITIKDEKFHNLEQTRKLCMVCDDCYEQLLNFLEVTDIDWE